MDFTEFKDWMMMGLLSGGVAILWSLKNSVDTLNISVAVIIEKVSGHEKRIGDLEDKV